jgi:hypothetical protein
MTTGELRDALLLYETRLAFTIKTDNGKQDLHESREALVNLLMEHQHPVPQGTGRYECGRTGEVIGIGIIS